MYINDHPEIIVIDPMESVQKLFDRITSYQIMKECEILEEGWLYNKAYQCNNNKKIIIIIFYERSEVAKSLWSSKFTLCRVGLLLMSKFTRYIYALNITLIYIFVVTHNTLALSKLCKINLQDMQSIINSCQVSWG